MKAIRKSTINKQSLSFERKKAKNYKSITEILDKKYNKGIVNKKDKINFYLFMDLQDCMNRIKQRKDQ
jgi:hypothetical protein